jgi:hypothetical protein
LLFGVLYTPETWSSEANTDIYAFVALALQASQALNITVPGGKKYNIPTGNITLNTSGDSPAPTLVSYSQAAIAGADDFVDGGVTIKDVFDIIVSNTREVTPTCEFSPPLGLFVALTHHQSSRNCLVTWVCEEGLISRTTF